MPTLICCKRVWDTDSGLESEVKEEPVSEDEFSSDEDFDEMDLEPSLHGEHYKQLGLDLNNESYSSDKDSCTSKLGLVLHQNSNNESDSKESNQEVNKIQDEKIEKKSTKRAKIPLKIPTFGNGPKRTLLDLVNICTS